MRDKFAAHIDKNQNDFKDCKLDKKETTIMIAKTYKMLSELMSEKFGVSPDANPKIEAMDLENLLKRIED